MIGVFHHYSPRRTSAARGWSARVARQHCPERRQCGVAASTLRLALTLTSVSPAHTQEVTVARLPVIRVEINAFFDQYYEWFSASRADLLAERVYAAPFYVGDGHYPPDT